MKTIHAVSFSPAGKTKAVAEMVAKDLGEQLSLPVMTDSFTLPSARKHPRMYSADDLVVFATPTYAGRVPNKALPFVQTLFQGNGAKAIALVTFGNRSFDHALAELCHELTAHGFHVIGAAAVVCTHSFAEIGTGRPDEEDRRILQNAIAHIATNLKEDAEDAVLTVPGGSPPWEYYQPMGIYGEKTVFLKAIPVADARCDKCGVCATLCPMGSIPADAPDTTTGICIKCQACVRFCPQGARAFLDEAFLSHKAMLEKNYTRRAGTEVFIPR